VNFQEIAVMYRTTLIRVSMLAGFCAAAVHAQVPQGWPTTRPERTSYKETSSYQDVVDFLDSLQTRAGDRIWIGSMGRTIEGRDLPYVIASRPLVTTPAEAKRLRRPVVYIQGNIHSGEVEGKEALQAFLRDVLAKTGPTVLDSLVFIAVPIYNADGNEKLQPQARARSAQNGPEMVGTRSNASGLNLNRDYMKAETPETRASLALFTEWDPDMYVDLHTSDGSPHGYALTYAPSLNPAGDLPYATFGASYTRDSLLPTIRRRMRTRHNFETFDYGNFGSDNPGGRGGGGAARGAPPGGRGAGGRGAGGRGSADSTAGRGGAGGRGGQGRGGQGRGGGGGGMTDTLPQAWRTYEHTGRFGSNYYAMRGRQAILSEAFSHDPLERRIKSTYALVEEILALVAEKRVSILAASEKSDRNLATGRLIGADVPIRSRMTTKPFKAPLRHEVFIRNPGDTTRYDAGIGPGIRRTGRVKTTVLNIYDRFEPVLSVKAPYAYIIPAIGTDSAVGLLRAHGVVVERLRAPWRGPGEVFAIDSAIKARGPFEGHVEMRLEGRWRAETIDAPAGSYVVRTSQPLGVLAVVLLEAQSDDGLVDWNFLDHLIGAGRDFPVLRARAPVKSPAWIVP
jgi:hypothetical protein